jgi:hypothetical protein
MIFTGKFVGVSRDWQTGQLNITFTVNEQTALEQIDRIQSCERLSIEAKKHRKKRSLDANAYLWLLCTKIADVVKSSKEEIYEQMLQRYGYFYKDDDGYITVTVKNEVDMSKISGHWKFLKSNGKFSSYLMIKGTSEYDTREMANFIDCVVTEAKELGIETLPPDELERMVKAWNP